MIRIAAVGDIMLGSDFPDVRSMPPHDGARLLDPVAGELKQADLTFGNLEGPMMDGGKPFKRVGPNSHAFRTPTRYGKYLREAGFDVLSLANNHASDFGAPGRAATRRTLKNLGIAFAGERGDIARLTVNGKRIALIAFATNAVAHNLNDIAGARSAVERARSGADLLIVSFHGGAEGTGSQRVPRGPETFLGEKRGDLRRFARTVVDAGADLVLGHGPHVVRGMEVYNGRLIAYSLGNFATYGKFGLSGPLGLSLILEAHVGDSGEFLTGRIHPVRQVKPGGPRPDPDRTIVPIVASLSRNDFGARAVRISPDGKIQPPVRK